MSTKPSFYPMWWGDDGVNNSAADPRYTAFSRSQAYDSDVPRTIAPEQMFRDPSQYFSQHSHGRSSRPGTNASEADYMVSAPTTTSRSNRPHQAVSRQSRKSISNGIEVDDQTQISSSKSQRYYCDFPDCIDENKNRRSVSRKADMKRHMQSVHGDPHIDCEYPKCDRKGDNGFRRKDHYREHRRGYHNELPGQKEGRQGS